MEIRLHVCKQNKSSHWQGGIIFFFSWEPSICWLFTCISSAGWGGSYVLYLFCTPTSMWGPTSSTPHTGLFRGVMEGKSKSSQYLIFGEFQDRPSTTKWSYMIYILFSTPPPQKKKHKPNAQCSNPLPQALRPSESSSSYATPCLQDFRLTLT